MNALTNEDRRKCLLKLIGAAEHVRICPYLTQPCTCGLTAVLAVAEEMYRELTPPPAFRDPRVSPEPGDILMRGNVIRRVSGKGLVFEVLEFEGTLEASRSPDAAWFTRYVHLRAHPGISHTVYHGDDWVTWAAGAAVLTAWVAP